MTATFRHVRLRYLLVASLLLIVYNCSFAQFVKKDLRTGLTTSGKDLSCDQVYLSDGEQVIRWNTFVYGETYYVNFDGVNGLEREDDIAFPDMQLLIVGEDGDTAVYYTDMYADYPDGFANDPLELYAEVTVADPMHSGENFTLFINISDKKGDGTLMSTLDFAVVRDDKIDVESETLSYRELYLYSKDFGHTITDGKVSFHETIYFLFEGLEGFTVQDGKVELGLSMLIRDGGGNVILEEADLFENGSQDFEDVHMQVASSLVLTGEEIANPVHYEIRIWDKQGSGWISASTRLVVE